MKNPDQKGFTLLEVLAALAVASLGLVAISQTMETGIRMSGSVEDRTLATWVASNRLSEMVLAREWPGTGSSTGEVTMGGRRWYLETEVEATSEEALRKVRVHVFTDGQRIDLAITKTGYLTLHRESEEGQGDG